LPQPIGCRGTAIEHLLIDATGFVLRVVDLSPAKHLTKRVVVTRTLTGSALFGTRQRLAVKREAEEDWGFAAGRGDGALGWLGAK
jgi:hypothetical protein